MTLRTIRLFFAIGLMALAVSGLNANAESPPLTTSIEWKQYSDTIFTQAKANKHLILIYGKSKTCHWCQEMDKNTWRSPAVIKQIQTNYIPIIVDVDSQFDLVTKYRMTSLPTMVIVGSDDHAIKIFSGYFPPDFMEKNLKEISDNYSHTSTTRTTLTKEEDIPQEVSLLPKATHEKLKQEQLSVYKNTQHITAIDELNSDMIEYALSLTQQYPVLIHAWIISKLTSYLQLNDTSWGGIYETSANHIVDYNKKTTSQGRTLSALSQVNIYWNNPTQIGIAKSIINYVSRFLINPDGAFYAGQLPYSTNQHENDQYYQLTDAKRRLLGLPKIDTRIFADANGHMIQGLTEFYMMSGDSQALDKAVKASKWIVNNLSITDGGFRHEKAVSDAIYLDDTLAMGNALLDLYKATANPEYLNRAIDAAKFINMYLQNSDGQFGYITALDSKKSPNAVLEVSATENADIIRFSSLLYSYTGEKFLQEMSLSSFKYLIQPNVYAQTLPSVILLSESRIINHPIHIVIIGAKNDPTAKSLYQTALASASFFSRIDWWDRKGNPLQNSDAEYPVMDKSAAYLCYAFHCSFPIYHSTDLSSMIHQLILPTNTVKNSVMSAPVVDQTLKDTPIGNSNNAEQLLVKKNVFLMILGFLVFGLLLSFTPCMLPLIPIMASIIVGHTIGIKKEKTFLLCLAYVISMSITYALLGIVAGEFGLYLQVYMQQAWVIVLFSLIFFILALSMLDAYELKLPSFILKRISTWSNAQKGGNYVGVIIMGALSTLIVSPCVSAPLAGALSFITKTGDYTLGAIGLFFMGFGMGLPLLILSVFSKNILPRVSRWNKNIKTTFGIVSLGLSVWVLSRVISDTISMALWSGWLIFTAINMGIFKRKTKKLFDKFWKTLAIMIFLCGSALLFNSLFLNSDLYSKFLMAQRVLSPRQKTVLFNDIKNKTDLNLALDAAKKNHLPVLLDFSAKWCTSCIHIERYILPSQAVSPLINQFVLLRVDLSKLDDERLNLAREFNVTGPPVMFFYDRNGKVIDLRVSGDIDSTALAQMLKNVIEIKETSEAQSEKLK
jgi:thiol:disulfide interchange protein